MAGRLVGEVFPQYPQDSARARHVDLLREAKEERLAATLRQGAPVRPPVWRLRALRWITVAVSRRPAAGTA